MAFDRIPRLVIDSTAALTDLCVLGYESGTDKSPFNPRGHRHPYTAVYTMLFAPLRNKPIRFAEIGVAMGASAEVWNRYFTAPGTKLCLFDSDKGLLEGTEKRVVDSRITTDLMDVSVDGDVVRALDAAATSEEEGGGPYDVIIDDSSHNYEHQIRIIREAFPRLKSGGMLIIEDIFRAEDEDRYTRAIQEELKGCAAAYFVMCEHANKFSPGWDNDKLLVLVKA
jgi:predicted O-methyltransferase YrrM